MIKEWKGDRFYRKDIKEDVCLVVEPGTTFLGHVSPKSGSAEDIEDSIWAYISAKYDTSEMSVIRGSADKSVA